MAKIGDATVSGFIVDPLDNGKTVANKFTAGATFTPDKIRVGFTESFGAAGTMYGAVYSDNAGAPDTKLFNGSAAYGSSFDGILTINVTGSQLTDGTAYWLAAYAFSSGTHNIDHDAVDSPSNQNVLTWTEAVEGSWTNTPSTSTLATDRDVAIEATDEAGTTTSTTSSTSTTTSTTSTTSSTSTTSTTSSTSTTSTTSSTSTSTTSTTSSTSSSTSTTSTSSSTTSTTTSTTQSITTSTSSTSTSTTSTTSSTSTSLTTSTSTTSTTSSTSTSTTSSTSTTTTWPYVMAVRDTNQFGVTSYEDELNIYIERD